MGCVSDGPLSEVFERGELGGYGASEEDIREAVERWLSDNGWAKVGYFKQAGFGLAYINVRGLNNRIFRAFKNILLGWNLDDNCQIEVQRPGRSVFYWEDFKNFDSPDDMKWFAENKAKSPYGWR
jgi:hypothetical protein